MISMIERVAESQAAFDGRSLSGMPMAERERYMERAKIAIREMREPTPEMILIGYDKINENIDSWNYDSDSGFAVDDIAPSETWRAMIDAALEGK